MPVNGQIWAEGCAAYLDGIPLINNPYGGDTIEHLDWADGWMDAQRRFDPCPIEAPPES